MARANTASAENSVATARGHGPGRPFPKGQSGNAGGRPKKDRALTAALDAELDKKIGRKTKRELVAVKVLSLALEGDMTAVKFLADRTEGLPIQRHRFDPEDLHQQAEALAEETGEPIEKVEPMLKQHLTLVK
jgi:hypothetical protein